MHKIAITGPESTGKSFLAEKLAKYYKTKFVPEYARNYIDQLCRPYNKDDLLTIAKNQLESEKYFYKKANNFLFCDTELIVIKIWSLHKYSYCHQWILDNILKNHYDLFLLCDIDMPWEHDPQREHPHLRKYFFDWYKKELESYGFDYRVVSGLGDERIQSGVDAIENFFSAKNK